MYTVGLQDSLDRYAQHHSHALEDGQASGSSLSRSDRHGQVWTAAGASDIGVIALSGVLESLRRCIQSSTGGTLSCGAMLALISWQTQVTDDE
jgi:hypothetical protein